MNHATCLTCSDRGNPPTPESFFPPDGQRDEGPSLWSPSTGRKKTNENKLFTLKVISISTKYVFLYSLCIFTVSQRPDATPPSVWISLNICNHVSPQSHVRGWLRNTSSALKSENILSALAVYVKCKRRGRGRASKWPRNSISLSHLSSWDMSSDLKAEIINETQPRQTNKNTHTHARRSQTSKAD